MLRLSLSMAKTRLSDVGFWGQSRRPARAPEMTLVTQKDGSPKRNRKLLGGNHQRLQANRSLGCVPVSTSDRERYFAG
jgi:hypothetical protein